MLKLQFRDRSRPDMWLVDPLIKIGSDASCHIVLSSDLVAPLHAELEVRDQSILFHHRAATKNSYINGELIASDKELKAWDIIKIGNTEMELVDPLLNRSPRVGQARQATAVRSVLSDWLIQAQTAPFSGQLFPVTHPLIIGRDTQSDIAVPMQHVSRKHCEVFVREGRLYVKDLSSANGTYVNGKKINEVELFRDDELGVDEFRFKVIFTGEANEGQKQKFHTTIRETQQNKEDLTLSAKTSPFPTPKEVEALSSFPEEDKPAFLHGKSTSLRGKVYEVEPSGSPIGRMLGHHLSREESSVSARHVEIFKKGRFWCIKNNGAANGLLVNGRMTTRATLVDGDEVTIGGMDLVFQCEGDEPRTLHFESEASNFGFEKVVMAIGVGLAILFVAYWILGS